MINVASFLDVSARRCPEATAFIHRGRRTSFGEIERCASRVANGLAAAGIGPGSRVALVSHNRPAMPAAYFGILKTGATAIMLNSHCTPRDIRQGLRDSGAVALLAQARLYDADVADTTAEVFEASPACRRLWFLPDDLDDAGPVEGYPTLAGLMDGRPDRFETVPVAPGQVAAVTFTSGTTGRRKGVETTHDNIASMVLITSQLGDPADCRVRIASNTLECVMGQLFMMVVPAYLGQSVVLMEDEDPERILRELVRWGGSYMIDVPMIYAQLIEAAGSVDRDAVRRSLRICATGGAGMDPGLPGRFAETFGARLLPGYGATETTSAITWTCPGDPWQPGSVGRPIPGVALRLLGPDGRAVAEGEAGEIWVRSPGVMRGYMDNPEATRRAVSEGWFRSGDLGTLGPAGELTLHRRLDNKINQGIDQVDPDEVEAILLEHPDVEDARVIGESHPVLGQLARTYVVPAAGRGTDPEALLRWLKGELPYGKSPERLELVGSLPAGPAVPPPLNPDSIGPGSIGPGSIGPRGAGQAPGPGPVPC